MIELYDLLELNDIYQDYVFFRDRHRKHAGSDLRHTALVDYHKVIVEEMSDDRT